MWPHSSKNNHWFLSAFLALLGACTPASAQTNATLQLKSGAALSGEIKTIGPASLAISLTGTSGSLTQNYADIASIEWPEPDLWQEATAAFDRGDAKEAMELFSQLAKSPAAISFYPAPGNFAERARRQMLECHRRLRNGAAITELARQIDWTKLPEDERTMSPLFKVWSLVGASNWQDAKAAAEQAAQALKIDDPDMLELAFLRALIAKELGLTEEAIATFAACYAFPSSDTSLAADALRESAALLLSLPERTDELKALAHLYATLIGRSKLWKDAPAEAIELLGEELASPLAPAELAAEGDMQAPATGSKPVPAATPGAWVTVTKIRFEPQPAGTPPTVPDPNNKPIKFEAVGGTFKSIDAPADWASAETRVGQLTSAKTHGTLVRGLKKEPLMQFAKGKTLRLTMELRLGKLDTKASKAVERVSFLRFGLLDANKAGYGINVSLMANDKGISIIADAGGDDDLLGGPGVVKVPAEGSADQGGVAGGKALPCEISLQLQEEGKVLVTARVDQISGTATFDSAAGQPVITDFSGGFFVIRLGKPRTSALFDNVAIEVSP